MQTAGVNNSCKLAQKPDTKDISTQRAIYPDRLKISVVNSRADNNLLMEKDFMND